MKKEFKDIICLFERVLNILDNLEKRIVVLEDKISEQSKNAIIFIKSPDKQLSKNYIYSNYIPIVIKDNGEYTERYELLYKTIEHNNCKFWIKEKCTINVEPVIEEKDNKFICLAKENKS